MKIYIFHNLIVETQSHTRRYDMTLKIDWFLVFIGYFSVLNTGSNTNKTYTNDQFANWKECCKRIKARWDINGAKNVCLGYNALRMNGSSMDPSWPGTLECSADLNYESQTIATIFSWIILNLFLSEHYINQSDLSINIFGVQLSISLWITCAFRQKN